MTNKEMYELKQKYKTKLWCDLETDRERVSFMRCGRAHETGIFADAVIRDLIKVYEFRAQKEA